MTSQKQVVFITGGNTGIGKEAVKALLKSPTQYEILLGTRSLSKGEEAISQLKDEIRQSASNVTLQQIDLSSDPSIKQAAKDIESKYGRLDALVNNAGSAYDPQVSRGEMPMRDAFNCTWDINVTGPHILTFHLAPLLIKSANPRILFVSSGTSSLGDTERFDTPGFQMINESPAAGWPKGEEALPMTSYRASKTGLNMIMRYWVRWLKNDNVKVWGLDPGFLATGFGGSNPADRKAMGAGEPSLGGDLIRSVVEGERDADVGKVVCEGGILPW